MDVLTIRKWERLKSAARRVHLSSGYTPSLSRPRA